MPSLLSDDHILGVTKAKAWTTTGQPYGAVGQSYQSSTDTTASFKWNAPDVSRTVPFTQLTAMLAGGAVQCHHVFYHDVWVQVEGVVVYDVYETHVVDTANTKAVRYRINELL